MPIRQSQIVRDTRCFRNVNFNWYTHEYLPVIEKLTLKMTANIYAAMGKS